jgi:hypothetical protein
MVAEDFERPVAVRRRPVYVFRRHLARRADHRAHDRIQPLEENRIGERLVLFLFQVEDARELAAIEADDRAPVDNRDGNVFNAQRPQLLERAGVVLDVARLELDSVLRKKLFRAGAGESAGAVVDLDVHRHSAAAFL